MRSKMSAKVVFVLVAVLCVCELLTVKGQDLRTDINTLLELAEDIDENVEGLENDIDHIEDEIDNAEDEVQDFGEVIENMETDVETVAAEVVNLRDEVKRELGDMKDELVSLRTDLEGEVGNLKQKVCEATEELTSLQGDMNSTLYILQELKNQLITMRQENLIQHQTLMSGSCSELHPTSLSGYYWLRGLSERVYCDMDRQSCGCGNPWGWMRVANIDMTDPNQQCPEGFRLTAGTTKRMCETIADDHPRTGKCVSITAPTHSVRYSRVCGRMRGYQYASPDAFIPYWNYRNLTIDDGYVEGLSITHGHSPRRHIWTFAAALHETHSSRWVCPCTKTDTPYNGVVPPFIGNDYFCDTGSRQHFQYGVLYTDDPLWDGKGCGLTSSCCQFNSPPWFCKELPQPTTDDIEVRVCRNQQHSDEDTPFDLIEMYVQ